MSIHICFSSRTLFHCALQRSAAAERELLALRQQRAQGDTAPPASLSSLLQELQACQQALEASKTTLATQAAQLKASGANADDLRGRLASCEHKRQAAVQEVTELRERLAAIEQARGWGESGQGAFPLVVVSSERGGSSAETLEGRAGTRQASDAAVQTSRPKDPAADLEAVFQERDVLRGQARTRGHVKLLVAFLEWHVGPKGLQPVDKGYKSASGAWCFWCKAFSATVLQSSNCFNCDDGLALKWDF